MRSVNVLPDAHPAQSCIQGILAHGPVGPAHSRKDETLWSSELLQLAQDGHCLGGQGFDVWLAHLHPRRRDGPQGSLEVEFGPISLPQLTRARIECQSALKRDPLSASKRDPLF